MPPAPRRSPSSPSSPRRRSSSSRRPRFVPVTDGAPHRAWSSLNVRSDEKRRFDILQKWWSHEREASLAHWDGFSILLAHYLDTAALPRELLDLLAADAAAAAQPM